MKCERDWQGPSDDECEDDLLVISCQREDEHKQHCGVALENYPGGTAIRGIIVYWNKGTEDLYRASNGTLYRRQFNDD